MFGKNKVSLPHIDRTSGLGAVHSSLGHTSAISRQAVRLARYRTSAMWVLGENLIFSPLSTFSPTSKAIRNTLKLSSLVCNLHAT
jgi:hypothetical protein